MQARDLLPGSAEYAARAAEAAAALGAQPPWSLASIPDAAADAGALAAWLGCSAAAARERLARAAGGGGLGGGGADERALVAGELRPLLARVRPACAGRLRRALKP